LALAVAFIFQAILDPGFYQIAIREIAREKSVVTKYLANIVTYKIIIAAISFIFLTTALQLISIPKETVYAIIIMLFAELLKSIKNAYSSAFHAFEYFNLDALVWTIERISLLVIGTFALMQGAGVVGFCLVFAVVRLLDLIIVLIISKINICELKLRFQIPFLKKLMIESLPVGLFLIILNLYTYIDTIMISAIRGDAEVGWYNAAFKIYEGLAVFPMIICTVFRPRISRTFYLNKPYFERLFPIGIKYVTVISLAVAVTGFLVSGIAIRTLFGEEYTHSIVALKILLCGVVFVFILTYFQMMLISIHQQKQVLKVAVLGLTFNILFNLFLIPRYGYVGASIATISSELIVLILLYLYVKTTEIQTQFYPTFGKPFLAMVVPVILVYIMPFEINLYLRIVVINILFIVLLFIFNVMNLKEFQFISMEDSLSI
jgi:O-antigen/teichoic acid export membrane protein